MKLTLLIISSLQNLPKRTLRLTILLAFLLTGSLAFAQPKKVVADKIIAIVGDKPVLKSDVTNSLADAQRQGEPVPENAECILVVKMLVQKALMFQAEKDSLPLAEEDVEAEMENRVRYYIGAYGGKEALEQIAQKSVYQIKEDSRPGIREQKLAYMMRNKIVDEVKISPTEVRAYYEKIPKDSLHFYESEVEIGEIVLYPKASRDLEKYAIEELNEYKRDVESGKQRFETLASLFTDDPGSKQTGGLYNLNRTEKNWDPTFLSTAFRLKKPGDVSNVIKSKFGYHIIQLVARNGDDATVRHILKIPQVTGAETEDATKKLDSVRANLIAGTISFGAAVSKYTEDESAKYSGGMRPPVTIDQLDKDLVLMLKDLKVGEYSKPVAFTDERQKKGIRIVYLKSKSEPHRENLADDFDRVKQRALTEKQNDALEKWFAAKIPTYYIMLDDDLKSCPELSLWAQGANMVRH